MPPTMDSEHYVEQVENMPPTVLVCKCGARFEGAECLTLMEAHVRDGNREGA